MRISLADLLRFTIKPYGFVTMTVLLSFAAKEVDSI